MENLLPQNLFKIFGELLLLVLVTSFISGCGVTLSPVKRKPLEIFPMETSLTSNSQPFLVRFESTLPGKPLSETVWDNVSGAFSDTNESEQIGFTQDYSKLVPVAAGGAVGGAIGGLVVGSSGMTRPDYTRIVIPFGRIFQEVFQSGLQKAFPNSSSCSDDLSESEKIQSTTPKYIVRLKVREFQVWEEPLNHLNMKAIVECKVYQSGKLNQLEYAYEAHHEIKNQSIGSVMSTSSGFIKEMDKISNAFAAVLSEDLLENLNKNLGN